jgi:DNA polymerase
MRTVFLDYETYYDKEYSLRKMTPVEYALDPRFETILAAVRENGKAYIVDGEDFPKWVKDAKLHEAAVISHNALFDMSILAWRYGTVPRLMIDTLGVSRATLGHVLKSLSLASVARHLGLGVKGDTVHNVIGMHRADIKAAGLWDSYCKYSAGDAELCEGIFNRQVKSGIFPVRELAVMDMVLRCAIEPKFMLDQNALAEHLQQVRSDKDALLQRVGIDKKALMSNEKFAAVLRSMGVEPPLKTSPLTGKETYAFAKTDKEFIALEEHPSPDVQALITARAGFKSTLEETRTERLLKIAQLTWPGNRQQLMPVPLRYSGAHTHRLSGEWKLNMQNLPRGGKLRRALIAKPDEEVFTIDASQIEARITAWICGQDDLVGQFAKGEDVYSSFASEVFGYPVGKKTHPNERFIGKTSVLGLGFQVGAAKFSNTIEVQSQLQLGQKIDMPLEEAMRIVSLYRTKYSNISRAWRTLHNEGIAALAGTNPGFTFGPCSFEKGAVLLPSGLRLFYHDLQQTNGERGPQWEFVYGGEYKKLYGGKLLENIVQSLARIITMDAALLIQRHLGLGMQVHDELVYGVKREAVEEFKALALQEMRRRPDWAPDLPLEAEAGTGSSYGEAK